MNNKQGKTHRLLDFFAGKGFYVVLILCVAAIGASGYMLFFGGSDETTDSPRLALVTPDKVSPSPTPPRVSPTPTVPAAPSATLPPASPPPLVAPPAEMPQSGIDSGNDVSVAAPVPEMPSIPPDAAPSPQQPAANSKPDFYPPVSGNLLIGYSESADVFYEALREWRYHPGVDIETNAGALVQASADGVILDVIENAPRNMGATVIIEHSGGYVTVYSNLSSTLTAEVGKTVKAGDTIGAVGMTSIAEQALPPHLHFEILKDGEPVDPMDYLP